MTPEAERSALLVSFYYLAPFLERQRDYVYRNWALDCGAYTAMGRGIKIDFEAYIRAAKVLREKDQTLTDIFALDVIGEWKPSLANCERMWREGIDAIPTYHAGEPEDYLRGIARDYPKIALGGVARWGLNKKVAWTEQCFARVWPKKIHGFGFGGRGYLERFPFHSVDATNWETGPAMFGTWEYFGTHLKGVSDNLRAEVLSYTQRERACQERWKKEMALIGGKPGEDPTVRLAIVCSGREMKAGLMREAGYGLDKLLERV